MNKTMGLLLAPCLALAIACSAGSYARVESGAVNPQFHGGPGAKVLVVVATPDPALREDMETQFAIQSMGRPFELVPSHRLVARLADLSRERLVELVRAGGFDRVLVTRPVPGSAETGSHTRESDYYAVQPPGLYDTWVGTIVLSPTTPPSSMGRYLKLAVETRMYDATDGTVIWTSTARVTTSERAGEAGASFVRTVLKQLTGARLLRGDS